MPPKNKEIIANNIAGLRNNKGMRRNNSLSGINEESSSNMSKKREFEEGDVANARPGNKNKRGKSNFAAVS